MNLYQMANYNPNLDVNLNQQNKVIHKIQKDLRNFMRAGQGIKGDYTFSAQEASFEYVFSTPFSTPYPGGTDSGQGVLAYDAANFNNYVVMNTFRKQPNWQIKEATLYMLFRKGSGYDGTSFGKVNIENIRVRLNPNEVANGGGGTPEWYTYTGGALLEDVFAITTNYESRVHAFTESEISSINNGFNNIVVQIEVSNPDKFGYCATVLVISGVRTAS